MHPLNPVRLTLLFQATQPRPTIGQEHVTVSCASNAGFISDASVVLRLAPSHHSAKMNGRYEMHPQIPAPYPQADPLSTPRRPPSLTFYLRLIHIQQ